MPTHTLNLTDVEIYVLQVALERLCDVEDRSYENIVSIANELSGKLPRNNITWKDVTN